MNGMQDFSAEELLDQMEEMQNEIEQKNDLIEDQETQLFQLKKTDGEKDCEIQRLNAFITNLNKESEDVLSKLKENRNKLEQDLKKERSRRQSLSETYQRVNSQYVTLLQEHDRLQRRYKQDISMAENRTKEIGIRKVLGASVFSVTRMLSKEFVLLVIIACIVAFPLAYWAMNSYLSTYAYRISVSWEIFLITAITAILIAIFTVSYQSIKAAIANPVNSLRDE